MSPQMAGVAVIYVATLLFGVSGNAWVVSSVVQSRRPRGGGSLTPSDRLRAYIGLLGVVDLLVVLVLAIRSSYLFLPNVTTSTRNCKIIFVIDHLVKLTSLSCLVCISVERYITIRKPFSSRVRKRLMHMTPLIALFQMLVIFASIGVLSSDVVADEEHTNCVRATTLLDIMPYSTISSAFSFQKIASWILAIGFLVQLCAVSFSYSQIVRHVRRKFWQRKARVVANTHIAARKPLIVSEPRYMKDMTAAIVKVACFHVFCLLPYCVLQVLPAGVYVMGIDGKLRIFSEFSTTALRFISLRNYADVLAWLALFADWLTYVNSAGNWIFYAAMNRDLRSIIRATTERRKRSTMSQNSPSTLHRSLRRQMTQSPRFFYSINSYKSNGNSMDESCSTLHNHPLTGSGRMLIGDDSHSSMSPSAVLTKNGGHHMYSHHHHNGGCHESRDLRHQRLHKISTASANGAVTTTCQNTEKHFVMRNNRAHTYCSTRALNRKSRSNVEFLSKCNTNKQMFFLFTGFASQFANEAKKSIISQLVTTNKASNVDAILTTTQVNNVNTALKQRIVDTELDETERDESASSSTSGNSSHETEESSFFSRIFFTVHR